MSGYSGTPLAKKLGIRENFNVKFVDQPAHYFQLFSDLPPVKEIKDGKTKVDFIHYFTKDAKALSSAIKSLKKQLVPNGMIWISWPKKTAKIPTDVTENVIREIALKNGLVDVKVCAVDETWSGLKLVIPVKDR